MRVKVTQNNFSLLLITEMCLVPFRFSLLPQDPADRRFNFFWESTTTWELLCQDIFLTRIIFDRRETYLSQHAINLRAISFVLELVLKLPVSSVFPRCPCVCQSVCETSRRCTFTQTSLSQIVTHSVIGPFYSFFQTSSGWIVHCSTIIWIPLENSVNHSTKLVLHSYKPKQCFVRNILYCRSYISCETLWKKECQP